MANPWEEDEVVAPAKAESLGQYGAGNIDLTNRPRVKNPDGSISTVRSMSANFDGQEVLLPTVSDDGRIMSDDEAIDQYRKTGRYLGKFKTVAEADAYADKLHREQEGLYAQPEAMPWDQDEVVGDMPITDLPQVNALPPDFSGVTSSVDSTAGQVAPDSWEYGPMRDAAFGVRSAIQGIGGTLGAIGGDAFNNYIANPVARQLGMAEARPYAQEAAALADRIGLPKAQTAGDRILGGIGEGLSSVATGFGVGGLARGAVNPIVANVGAQTLANPGLQVASTVAGTGAAGGVKELGGGPIAQLSAGLIGGISPSLALGAGNLARNVASRSGLSSTERRAANIIRQEASSPEYLEFSESAVPGVSRTVGEATQDPGLMALENTMRARNRQAFDPIDMENNAARVAQLERIAGNEADMSAAVAARDAVVDTSLRRAMAEGAQSASAAQSAQSAARQKAIQAVRDAEKENQRLASLGIPSRVVVPEIPPEGSTVSQGLQDLRAMASRIRDENAPRQAVQAAINDVKVSLDAAGDSVDDLYKARKNIDDLLQGKAGSEKSYAKAASRELLEIKSALDAELAKRAPSFTEYLDSYKVASKPINRMEVGREILDRSSGAVQDVSGNPVLTPAAFSRVTNDLDAIAARATGFKKAKADAILTPSDMSVLSAIQDDMRRIFARNRSAASGSQTAERLSIGDRIARKSVASRAPWVGQFFEHFEQRSNDMLNEKLAFLLANPSEARRVIKALPKQNADKVRNALAQLAIVSGVSGDSTSQEDK